jgi:phosphomannomutase
MKTVYMFDVDGTLTPARQRMKSPFKKFFLEWSQDKIYYLITGSDIKKTRSQVPESIINNARGVFTCMGNVLHIQEEKVYENKFEPSDRLLNHLNRFLQKTGYVLRTGNHIEYRPGMINFSIVGRNASHMQREGYYTYDCRTKEREKIASFINENFKDEIEATIGGKISIDIYPIGSHKGQAFQWIHHKVGTPRTNYRFFGDQVKPGGNDWDLVKEMEKLKVTHSYHCVKNDRETFSLLKSQKLTNNVTLT